MNPERRSDARVGVFTIGLEQGPTHHWCLEVGHRVNTLRKVVRPCLEVVEVG